MGRSDLPVRPGVEVARLALDDRDRLGDFRAAAIQLPGHRLLQRPHVHARDARHLAGLNRRRYAQTSTTISGPAAPRRDRRMQRRLRDDVHRRIHRAEDDVGIGQ